MFSGNRPEHFEIKLAKEIYFPGETIKGELILHTTHETKCRGIRVQLKGEGHCEFVTGSGDNKQRHSHTKLYANTKRTFYGTVYKTPVLENAGANAIYGPPWCPDEGVLLVGVPDGARSLALRVMDHNYLTKDEVIGEVCTDLHDLSEDTVVRELPLTRKGVQVNGTIQFSLTWVDGSNEMYDAENRSMRSLQVRIMKATGLRQASFLDKNDVYVQAYVLDTPPVAGAELPVPNENIVIPSGHMVIPFQFRLPAVCPSSIVHSGNDYIAYSIYAHIDIAWQKDPSTRRFFTVLQPQDAPAAQTEPSKSLPAAIYTQCCIPPLCCVSIPLCCLGSQGEMTISAKLDRSVYAPGEVIRIAVDMGSQWPTVREHVVSATVKLEQFMVFSTGNAHERRTVALVSNTGLSMGASETSLVVPTVPPTFNMSQGEEYVKWMALMVQYGNRYVSNCGVDPFQWSYYITVEVAANMPGCAIGPQVFSLSVPVTITALGTAAATDPIMVVSPMVMERTGGMPPLASPAPVAYVATPSLTQVSIRHPQEDIGAQNLDDLRYVAHYYVATAVSAPPSAPASPTAISPVSPGGYIMVDK